MKVKQKVRKKLITKMLDTYIFASHVFDGPPFVMPSLVQNFLIVTDITNMLVKIVAMNREPESIKYVWVLSNAPLRPG